VVRVGDPPTTRRAAGHRAVIAGVGAASDGRTHLVDLSSDGVSVDPPAAGSPALTVHGTAGELVLGLYDRIPLDSLRLDGDASLLAELRSWAHA
jgi:hypothetical protein